jgi:hypothetical protein
MFFNSFNMLCHIQCHKLLFQLLELPVDLANVVFFYRIAKDLSKVSHYASPKLLMFLISDSIEPFS